MPAAGRAVPNAAPVVDAQPRNAAPKLTVVAPRDSTLPDTVRSPYAPGLIRRQSDAQAAAVSAFLEDHPEFADQPFDVVSQYMDRRAGYRSDDELAVRDTVRDEGVSDDWSPEPDVDDEHTHRWSDDA